MEQHTADTVHFDDHYPHGRFRTVTVIEHHAGDLGHDHNQLGEAAWCLG